MKITLIACKTIEDEVSLAIEKTGKCFRIHWIESGLHYYPDKLKESLQECINSITDSEFIVLLFGLCGNALLGLYSESATLVIPKVDDCISLMLGGNSTRKGMEDASKAYYLTKGWLRFDINIWHEYTRSIERYGIERTRSVFQTMLKNYTHLVVIDTGAYNIRKFIIETRKIAEELGLEHKVVPGDMKLLTAALDENWAEGFALIKPGTKVTPQSLGTFETSF